MALFGQDYLGATASPGERVDGNWCLTRRTILTDEQIPSCPIGSSEAMVLVIANPIITTALEHCETR